jgi:hypothetical protein
MPSRAVPVLDPRVELGLPTTRPDQEHCLILLAAGRGEDPGRVGLLVDSVTRVLPMAAFGSSRGDVMATPLDPAWLLKEWERSMVRE